jgi:hypothetical protein
VSALTASIAAFAAGGCATDESDGEPARVSDAPSVTAADPGPIHIHGLGVDPGDGALMIATHTGLFRLAESAERAERVTDRRQDTMGFTVIGANRYLGSGHPDLREAAERDLPAHLGLIESVDGGRSWEPVSLLGEADLHVLRARRERVVAFDALGGRLLVSRDHGKTWSERRAPDGLIDLALDPRDDNRLLATTTQGMAESEDDGRSWRPLDRLTGLLAWDAPERLVLIDGAGAVWVSSDGGASWRSVGAIESAPVALAADETQLHAALHDGTILRSTDGGVSWEALRT